MAARSAEPPVWRHSAEAVHLTSAEVPSTEWAPHSARLGPSRRDALVMTGSPSLRLPEQFLAEIDVDLATRRLPSRGRPALLDAIAAHLDQTTGVGLDPASQIAVTNGAMQALDCVFRALVPSGATVGMVCPTFFADRLLRGRVRLVGVDTRREDGWHLGEEVLEDLRAQALDVLFLVNPNNPTGVVYTEEELRAVLDATAPTGPWWSSMRPMRPSCTTAAGTSAPWRWTRRVTAW